jgi:hypothetical protein
MGIRKMRHGGTRWELKSWSLFLSQVLLKLMVTYGKRRTW